MIVYDEPCPGLDEQGNEVTCNCQVSVTTEEAIKIQRWVVSKVLAKRGLHHIEVVNELMRIHTNNLLKDYIAVHWAKESNDPT